MPKIPVYGCEELKRCLIVLGFTIDESLGKGGHALAKHPTKKPTHGQAPYITIRGLKEYADPNFRSTIVKQIVCFGFTRDEVIEALNRSK
jgi:hypothetical protein